MVPSSVVTAQILMFITMVLWGSTGNTQKLAKTRFEYYNWGYLTSQLVAAIIFAATFGMMGSGEKVTDNIMHAQTSAIVLALVAGVIFAVGDFLIVAAIGIGGIAVAFSVGMGVATVTGTILGYIVDPVDSVPLLAAGLVVLVAAIFFESRANSKASGKKQSHLKRALIIAVIGGLLLGCQFPIADIPMQGAHPLNAYSVLLLISIGAFVANFPVNYYFMRKPLGDEPPIRMDGYWHAPLRVHAWSWLGGLMYNSGFLFSLLAAPLAGAAAAWAFGNGSPLIGILWGLFLWKEFKGVVGAGKFLAAMFACYTVGLVLIGLSSGI